MGQYTVASQDLNILKFELLKLSQEKHFKSVHLILVIDCCYTSLFVCMHFLNIGKAISFSSKGHS